MSPFPGIKEGSDMEKNLDSCIESIMKEHKGEEDFGKSNAVAICRESLKADGDANGIALETVSAEQLSEYGNHALFANIEPGSLLRFKNAHLCSTGENRNRDWVDEVGVKELADTMHFRAIDDEHDPQKVIGFFVNPRTEDNSTKLMTDGVIYADRFPTIAAQVQNGTKKLSVEAMAQKAVCSVCNGEFGVVGEYCEHLKNKPKYNAARKLYGLKARGGATVFHPAWETSFDKNGFVMIASDLDCGCADKKVVEVSVKEPTWIQDLKAWVEKRLAPVLEAEDKKKWSKEVDLKEGSLESLGWPSYEKLAKSLKGGKVSYKKLIGKLNFLRNITKDAATKKKAANFISRLQKGRENTTKGGTKMFEIVDGETLEEFKTRLELVAASELEAKETELKAAFETSTTELKAGFEAREAELKAETDKVKVGFERALELGMNSEQSTILAGLDEDAFVLFKQQQKEVKIEASDEEEVTTVEAGQLQGQVLSTTEVVDKPLSLQGMGEFLSGKIKGGK